VPARADERSDQQLLQAWNGRDRRAFAELDRRYRPLIRHLARSMRFRREDAEEIVQETLLSLFLGRRAYRDDCTPERFVSDLAATAVLAHERGVRRRTRLLSAAADAAATNRAEQECGGQPDEGLLTAELAAQIDAAVRRLRGRCRCVFRLRAMQGRSAREAGATLKLPPALVEVWLLLARRLIADQLHPRLA
jgi:RNA polymerase sigma factor (sigma-70 family)